MQSLDTADASTLPTELSSGSPRKVRLTGTGIVTAVLAVLFLCVGAAVTINAFNEYRNQTALRANNVQITGHITDFRHVGRSRTPTVYYTFSVNGQDFFGQSRSPQELPRSGPLNIRYLPSDPSINHPADWDWSLYQDSALLLAPVLFLVLPGVFWFNLRADRRIALEGIAVIGTVTGSYRSRNGLVVKYEFRAANGESVTGRSSSKDDPEAGDPICILYLADNPARNRAYPLQNYRITPLNTL